MGRDGLVARGLASRFGSAVVFFSVDGLVGRALGAAVEDERREQ